MGCKRLAAACLAALIAGGAWADTVILKDGTVIEGKVVSREGETVVIEVAVGRLKATQKIPRRDVARIEAGLTENERAVAEVERRRKALRENDAGGWFAFGKWVQSQNGFSRDARSAFMKAIQIDPNHAEARKALGFMKDDRGRWRPEEDVMAERGLFRFEGKWVTPAEREDIILARRLEKAEQVAARRQRLLREAEMRLEYRDPYNDYRDRYRSSLLHRLGYYGPGYYYEGMPVIEGTALGGSFYGTVGVRPYAPPPPAYYSSPSPGIIIQGGDTTFTFGSGRTGWNWGLSFSGSRGNSSWSGTIGGGGQ